MSNAIYSQHVQCAPAVARLYLQGIGATLQPKEAWNSMHRSSAASNMFLQQIVQVTFATCAPSSPQKVPQELRMRQKGVPVTGPSPRSRRHDQSEMAT
jgi:hypothetical protein